MSIGSSLPSGQNALSQLSDSTDHPEPVIEPSNGVATVDRTTRALHLRIRQQEILAELGVLALQGKPFLDLLDQTARLTAEGMEAQFCKVLEYLPAENRFLVPLAWVGMKACWRGDHWRRS